MYQNKRTCFSLLVLLSTLFSLTSCVIIPNTIRGTGDLVSVEVPVPGISEVVLTTHGEMVIQLGDDEKLIIEAQENLQPYLETRQVNGRLTIESKDGFNLDPTKPIRYLLTVKNIHSLTVTSVGGITAPALEADQFQVKISSAGDIYIESLIADSLEVSLSSVGDLKIAGGQVETQDVRISSAGNYTAGDLRSQQAEVHVSSSGDVILWTTDRLDVSISSSGDVSYYGSPQVISSITSSGDLIRLGDKE